MKSNYLKPFVISPPFGRWLNKRWATSIDGSYTILRRPGLVRQVLKTVRKTETGYINEIGLRNPGLLSDPQKRDLRKVLSFVPIGVEDWDIFLRIMPSALMVEINLGCPNIKEERVVASRAIDTGSTFKEFLKKYPLVIIKLPPNDDALAYFMLGYEHGVRVFHLCNTLYTPNGGLSGYPVKERAIPLIETIRKWATNDDYSIIGGGGIYSRQDATDYLNAGADHLSLSTVFFTPWKVRKIRKSYK